MKYYTHHIGDYMRDTSHLSLLEHGVYRQAIDMYYKNEMPLPKDKDRLMRLLCVRNADDENALDIVLAEFFELTEDGYRHARCDRELRAIYDKSEKARLSAKARWDKEKQRVNCGNDANAMRTHNERIANGMLPNTRNPIPINPEPNLKPLSGKPDDSAKLILDYLNNKTGKKFRAVESNLRLIRARLAEGITESELMQVVDRKISDWDGTKMEIYLRPETLFGATKCNQYVGELSKLSKDQELEIEIREWIGDSGVIDGEVYDG